MNGAALARRATWDSQGPQGLMVYLTPRANPGSQVHQAFRALQVGPLEEEPQLDSLKPGPWDLAPQGASAAVCQGQGLEGSSTFKMSYGSQSQGAMAMPSRRDFCTLASKRVAHILPRPSSVALLPFSQFGKPP